MKIELIRQRFNDTRGYKYKPFDFCCDKIGDNPCISFSDRVEIEEDNNSEYVFPAFALCYTERDYDMDWDIYYKINHCPFCGEMIEISVVDEEDVDEIYQSLTKQREELWKKYVRTDSKRKSEEYCGQVRKLDNQISWFHQLTEYKKN